MLKELERIAFHMNACHGWKSRRIGKIKEQIAQYDGVETKVMFTCKDEIELFSIIQENEVTFVFQGSRSLRDWMRNLAFWFTSFKDWDGGERGMFAHHGFGNRSRQHIREILKLNHHLGKQRRVTFTGHSQGGVIAMLAAKLYSEWYETGEKVQCYTFGAPALGNVKLMDWITSTVEIHRVVTFWDVVTWVNRWLPFQSANVQGKLYWFDEYGDLHITPAGDAYQMPARDWHGILKALTGTTEANAIVSHSPALYSALCSRAASQAPRN